MGSSPSVVPGGGWRWRNGGGRSSESRALLSAFGYFVFSFVVLGSIGGFYSRYMLVANVRAGAGDLGCQDDGEGSWAVGVYYGDSPFSLKPLEDMNVWKEKAAAWPLANPVITCASLSDVGIPTNFVADPFLYAQGDVLYMFYEAKNSVTMQGDIGVAKSTDNGATWQQLGIALDEDWHLSYPYVFEYNGNIYMMPEGSGKGDLRLYRATHFPLHWTLEQIIMKKPLVDSIIIRWKRKFYLFASDHTEIGAKKNGHLDIWHSTSPLGPWKPHRKNPIFNTNKTMGARNGGRPFEYNGHLYRIGQDCGQTYGHRTRVFRVDVLTINTYKEVEVPLTFENPLKGRNAWNGARHHHMDIQQLGSGKWIAVIDGDRVPSGDSTRRYLIGLFSVISVVLLVFLVGILLGAMKCVVPLRWCPHNEEKRSDGFLIRERERPNVFLSSKLRLFFSRLNRFFSTLHSKLMPISCVGIIILVLLITLGVMLTCTGVRFLYGGSGAQEPYPVNGHYSQFTLLTMTYDARLWNLKMYISHYSQCASVREIVVVWNKGVPPKASDFDSKVPVRIRVEKRNSLNNRFIVDKLITTRAVLELDDDIMMGCDDIERGFKVWRENPGRVVGFYPRLVGPGLEYRGEKHARRYGGYNMILTGAAFVDHEVGFRRYWGEEAREGRDLVDRFFNCEDVLMNYLYVNGSGSEGVEYVRARWVFDMSKFSGVAISRNTRAHYGVRSECLRAFEGMYGGLSRGRVEFGRRKDGWDV